jgi:hypothetical protein
MHPFQLPSLLNPGGMTDNSLAIHRHETSEEEKPDMKIKIEIGHVTMEAELNDTPTAALIADALPISSRFSTWGDEIYFSIPVEAALDDSAREVVEVGDLGYWPTGKAFCIFFGPTPASTSQQPVPASAVNVVGRALGDAKRFKEVMRERLVKLEKA